MDLSSAIIEPVSTLSKSGKEKKITSPKSKPMASPEPLLQDNPDRYVMFPIQDNDIWKMYKKQEDCFWRVEEIDFSKDQAHWDKMTDNERYFIKMVLAFFAASDGIVLENLAYAFYE